MQNWIMVLAAWSLVCQYYDVTMSVHPHKSVLVLMCPFIILGHKTPNKHPHLHPYPHPHHCRFRSVINGLQAHSFQILEVSYCKYWYVLQRMTIIRQIAIMSHILQVCCVNCPLQTLVVCTPLTVKFRKLSTPTNGIGYICPAYSWPYHCVL